MVQNSIHKIDYIIVIISLVIPLVVSLWFSRDQKNTSNFFKAGGKLPGWVVGMSILATLVSSVTFLAYPGDGFKNNWIKLLQGIMVPVTLLFFIRFIVPLYRNVIKLSAYEYFEKRFGFFARIYGSVGFFLAHFAKMGTVFYLVAVAFTEMIGLDTQQTIWIAGLVVIFITLIGGIEAVVWLDMFQGFLLIIGGIVVLFIISFSIDGGMSQIWKIAGENNRLGFGPYNFSFYKLTFWVMVINGIFYAIQKYGTDQTIVQRYLTAKSDKSAIRASMFGVLMTVPVWALFMFIGTALFVYYKINVSELPEGIEAIKVFPHFIMTKLPPGVVGLILASLLAAAISSLDSDLNCLSAICVEDYYARFKPQSTDKQRMFTGRLVIILAGLASILVAMYYVKLGGQKGVLNTIFTLYAIFSGGIAGMFLLGIFTKKANKKGLYIGIAASVLFTAWAMLTSAKINFEGGGRILLDLGNFNYTHHKYMIGVYSHIILFLVGYFASFWFRGEKDTTGLTYQEWNKSKKQNTHKN